MALDLKTGGTSSSTFSLSGAADLLSIIQGKNTTTSSTTTGGGGTTVSQTGGGTASTTGYTSSSGTNSSSTTQSSTGSTNQTGTTTGSTVVDQIVANSGSTNLTSQSGLTTGSTTNSGSTNTTAGSTNTHSGSVNTNSGYTTSGAASVNTGSQLSNQTASTSSRTKIGGRTDVSTTKSVISKEAMDAMLQAMLSKTDGLASVSQGVRAGGGYGGSTNTLLSNDLLTRAAAAVAEATRETVSTNVIGDSYNETSGTTGTVGSASSVNNIGGTSSTVGPSTQTIGGSSTTIGPTSTTIGGSTSTSNQNSSTNGTTIVGGSSSHTTGTNSTTGTNTSTGTSTSTGNTSTIGSSSTSGSTGGTSTTSPTTTTTTTTPNSTTVSGETHVAGVGMEGLAGIIGLGVGVPLAVDAVTSLIGSAAGALSGGKTAAGATTTNNTPVGSPTPDPVDHSTSDSIYGGGTDSIFTEPPPDFSGIPTDIPPVDLPTLEFADGGRVPGYADGGEVTKYYTGSGDNMEVDNTAEVAKRASEQEAYTAKHAMSRDDFIKKYGETFVANDKGGNAASEVHGQNVGEYYDKYLAKDAKKTQTVSHGWDSDSTEEAINWGAGKYRYTNPYFDGYDNVNPHPESNLGNGLQETMRQLKPVAMAASMYSGIGALGGILSGGVSALSAEAVATKIGNELTGGTFGNVVNVGKLLANPSTSGVANFLIGMNPAGKLINSIAGLTGLPKIGNLISNMMEPTPELPMRSAEQEAQTANIVSSTPPDQLIAALTEPQKATKIPGFADGELVTGAKTGGPNEDVADNKTVKVTPGEFIVPVDVVEKPGVLDYLEKLVREHHVPADVQKMKNGMRA